MRVDWKWRALGMAFIWSFFGLIAAGVLYEADYMSGLVFVVLTLCLIVFWGMVASAIFLWKS